MTDQTGVSLDLDFRAKLPERKDVPIGCIGAGFIMADCHLVAYREAGVMKMYGFGGFGWDLY